MRQVLITGTILAFSAAAWAQAPAPPAAPLPVEQMTCEQMYAEMAMGGARMASQLDPTFAPNALALYNRANPGAAAIAGQMAAGAAMSAACSVPGAAMACMAMQQQQAMAAGAQAAQNQAEMMALAGQVQQSTAGLDMARMQAIAARVEALKCPQPRGPGDPAPAP